MDLLPLKEKMAMLIYFILGSVGFSIIVGFVIWAWFLKEKKIIYK